MKDHQRAEFTNKLRDAAIKYQGTQQLRSRLAAVVDECITKDKNIEAERDALRLKLIETAQELHCMIDMSNAKLEQDISATDDSPPDYFDAQTVHEAMILANKLEGKG
jgi:hypothetical protein